MSVFTELHRALYERLKNSLSVEVYDYVPDDAEFPFVNVGELNSVTLSTKDGKSVDLYEVTSTIHVFSQTSLRITNQIHFSGICARNSIRR